MKEYLLTTNSFNKPRVAVDKEAACILIVKLLMMNPGDSRINPEAGVGIVKRFRYIGENDIDQLESETQTQIGLYLPELQGANVSFTLDEKIVYITIEIDDTIFKYKLGDDDDQIQVYTGDGTYQSLSNL